VNNLSLLIYLAGVTERLGGFLVFVATVFGLLSVVCAIVWIVSLDTSNFSTAGRAENVRIHSWRWIWSFLALMIFVGS